MPKDGRFENWAESFPREEVEQRVRELEAEIARLRTALDLFTGSAGSIPALNGAGEVAPYGDTGRPSRPDAILAIMREAPDKVWKPNALFNEMVRRGWTLKTESYRSRFYTTLKRMVGDGRLAREGDFYSLTARTRA